MTAHLMTRGTPRRLDYRFLGTSSPERWWTPLADWIVLEEAAVVVNGGGPAGARVLVSGIPSARRDVIGTAIRFTLVVDGADPGLLARLAAAGLDPEERTKLGSVLDAQFPAEWVDAALDGRPPAGDDVDTRLARALEATGGDAPTSDPVDSDATSSWVWAAGNELAVSAFLDRVAKLGAGTEGWAFTTAALTTVDGALRAAAALDAPVAVLLGEDGPAERVDVGKAPAGRRRRLTRRALLISVVVLAALVLLGLAARTIWASWVPACDPVAPPNSTSSTPTGCAGPE